MFSRCVVMFSVRFVFVVVALEVLALALAPLLAVLVLVMQLMRVLVAGFVGCAGGAGVFAGIR